MVHWIGEAQWGGAFKVLASKKGFNETDFALEYREGVFRSCQREPTVDSGESED
jgi:hypothetical protein